MAKLLSYNFLSPLLVGFAVWIAAVSPTSANPVSKETPNNNPSQSSAEPGVSLATELQVDQAREASEIRPGDWAYQTLQSLSTKYGCSDTPAGTKVLSREEFATSLNGCLQSIEGLVARKPRKVLKKRRVVTPAAPTQVMPQVQPEVAPPAPTPVQPPAPVEPAEPEVSQQDLDRLKQLVQSFSSDLQSVDSRVQAVDDKVAKLRAQAFSTTTKLNGEAIFSFSGYNTGRANGITSSATATPPNTFYGTTGNVLSDRVRLNFDTSFTGKDRLRTRLQSRNTPNFSTATGTNMTRLSYDGDESNNTSVAVLNYGFPLTPQTRVTVDVVGSRFYDHLTSFNPVLASSGGGSISRFGRFDPVLRLAAEGAALTVNHKFSDELGLAIGYAVPNINAAANPAQNSGVFNGSNAIIGQLNFNPSKDLGVGLVYARTYTTNGANLQGGTGSSAANSPFGAVPTSANYYSFQTSYKLSPSFILSGWAGFTEANRETAAGGNASASNYAVSFAFPDFAAKGNNLAFILGIPPKLNGRSGTGLATATSANPDTSYHIEALYRVKLSDNFAVTPGLLLITNPEHNSVNPTEYVGTIRSTFTF